MSQAKLVDPSDVSPPTWEQRPLVHLNTRLIIHSLIGSSRPLIGVGYDDLEADRAGGGDVFSSSSFQRRDDILFFQTVYE